jgi:hypothetical protein
LPRITEFSAKKIASGATKAAKAIEFRFAMVAAKLLSAAKTGGSERVPRDDVRLGATIPGDPP